MNIGDEIRVTQTTTGIVLAISSGSAHLKVAGGQTWWVVTDDAQPDRQKVTVEILTPNPVCTHCGRGGDS